MFGTTACIWGLSNVSSVGIYQLRGTWLELMTLHLLQVNPVTFAHSPEEYFIAVGLQQTTPSSHLKTELTEGAADRATASEAADATDGKSDSAGTQAAKSAGQDQQGMSQTAPWRHNQTQSAAQRALSLHQTASGQVPAVKAEPSSLSFSDNSRGQSQTALGPGLTAPRPTKFPLGSPARIVPLSSVQPSGPSQHAPPQGALAPRAITVPHAFPLGSTTGIVGRSWPGQPVYGQPVGSNGKPVSAGSGLNESRGTKRAGGAESKSRKRQKQGDREKSADGEGGMMPVSSQMHAVCISNLCSACLVPIL